MKLYELLSTLKLKGLSIANSYEIISFIEKIPFNSAKTLASNQNFNDEIIFKIFEDIDKGIPIAYITNSREFYGYEFYINEKVLIPRVETEILIDIAKEKIISEGVTEICDLFTGSGVILITLLNQFELMKGCGVDISTDALNIADINKKRFNLEKRAEFFKKDLAIESNIGYLFDRYELITANPPYIDEADYEKLEKSVKYEPKIALTSKDCGLFYYNMLLFQSSFVKSKLRHLIMEIGYNQAEKLAEIAEGYNLNFSFQKDYSGTDRVMIVSID